MLNGIDPIIIFNFKKIPPSVQAVLQKIPLLETVVQAIDLPVIPIYLSERLTGIYIDTESKSMEIDTAIETTSLGDAPVVNQRGIQNTVRVEMVASKDSIGVSLFSALSDLIFPKVTSREYSLTYLHGSITVFGGLLHSFAITQEAGTDLYKITLELMKPSPKIATVVVPKTATGTVPL